LDTGIFYINEQINRERFSKELTKYSCHSHQAVTTLCGNTWKKSHDILLNFTNNTLKSIHGTWKILGPFMENLLVVLRKTMDFHPFSMLSSQKDHGFPSIFHVVSWKINGKKHGQNVVYSWKSLQSP